MSQTLDPLPIYPFPLIRNRPLPPTNPLPVETKSVLPSPHIIHDGLLLFKILVGSPVAPGALDCRRTINENLVWSLVRMDGRVGNAFDAVPVLSID